MYAQDVKHHWGLLFPCRFHRFNLINFTGRIYSGNGNLLQGDIYRGGADGRAAWREIKSDCLGKSEPSTRAIGTATALRTRPEHLPSVESPCCIPATKEKNTKDIRIGTLADLQARPWASFRLLARTFQPVSMPLRARRGATLPRARSPPKVFPEQR